MPIRVLIVEDNAVARGFLARVVRESFSDELSFVEAAGIEAASAALDLQGDGTEAFRLILCDLEQPDQAGLTLLARLAGYPAIRIATTLHSDDDHLFPALQCGASGYLLKEDRFEVLVEELQRIVRGQPPLSPSMARRMQAFLRAQNLPEGDARALTPRESEVLLQISKGFTVKEIARLMGMKGQMVNEHIRGAYRKLALASAPQQALLAGATLDT
ncbi:DNA-binding NarL/FixJ family response regulator [Sphaerotilus sulfidivorans]|jgi:DNA-binding NarL/FixJ family response regulator|uniref:DNA-binding NarL/FixJ family response regulator n=1 Tax=Sphaerotilus sulfidivorans TaxID=639200 RepID=A0A5C1Q300_9BURK|nr:MULTISPECIES: response regulator transcription factor [Sphaerotilus]NZD45614.1 response regulator transcription factor [Sphaerotilus sulfidivorans]QEN00432.1 response regulator transcription factor [Sphaerotilus sulfidivorans]GKQ59378.1 DNA-binding response regulator [Sphaerotilus sp. FB-3]